MRRAAIRRGGRERMEELAASFPADWGGVFDTVGLSSHGAGAPVKVTLLGHSTILVDTGPMRILMDPVLQDPFENRMVVSCPPRAIDLDCLGRFSPCGAKRPPRRLSNWETAAILEYHEGPSTARTTSI